MKKKSLTHSREGLCLSGFLSLAGSRGGLGFLQVDGLNLQNLAVGNFAGLQLIVVGTDAVLSTDHVAGMHQVVDSAVCGAVCGYIGIQLDELAVLDSLAVGALGLEVVGYSDSQLDLLGAVLVLEDSGIPGQTAFSNAKISHVNHSVISPLS